MKSHGIMVKNYFFGSKMFQLICICWCYYMLLHVFWMSCSFFWARFALGEDWASDFRWCYVTINQQWKIRNIHLFSSFSHHFPIRSHHHFPIKRLKVSTLFIDASAAAPVTDSLRAQDRSKCWMPGWFSWSVSHMAEKLSSKSMRGMWHL